MNEGRPLKFKSVKELEKKIDAYVESCWYEEVKTDKDGKEYTFRAQMKPYTITGVALALETTRETLLDYENGSRDNEETGEKYSDTIKKIKMLCHNYAEEYLFTGKNQAGAIFNLKNNYGWKDKAEVEHSGSLLGSMLSEIDGKTKSVEES